MPATNPAESVANRLTDDAPETSGDASAAPAGEAEGGAAADDGSGAESSDEEDEPAAPAAAREEDEALRAAAAAEAEEAERRREELATSRRLSAELDELDDDLAIQPEADDLIDAGGAPVDDLGEEDD